MDIGSNLVDQCIQNFIFSQYELLQVLRQGSHIVRDVGDLIEEPYDVKVGP